MSRRNELEARLALFGELDGIMNAMRSFALVELRRLARREVAQQQAGATLALAMRELSGALPPSEPGSGDIWIVLGSARGFCAGLNDELLRFWRTHAGNALATVAVGERLLALMPKGAIAVSGAVGAADAVAALDRILEAVEQARKRTGQRNGSHGGLVVCSRDAGAVALKRLLPLPREPGPGRPQAPLTNGPAPEVALGVAEHYLFHTLLALLTSALREENHLRLMQMENARQHIDRASATLTSQRNALRQEEIVEEIEQVRRSGMPGLP
jgi:F-type H+-transporting ATPase subunit gamma